MVDLWDEAPVQIAQLQEIQNIAHEVSHIVREIDQNMDQENCDHCDVPQVVSLD